MFPWQQVDEEAESTRPKGHIEWLKDGEVIVTEGTKKYRQYRKKGLLQINNIGCGDQGVYECRYNSSRWGEAGRTELHIAPVVSNVPLIQTVIAGTLVTVRCDVMCEGNDIITWTKSGRIVANSNGTSLRSRYSVLENGSLFIDTALHGDSGCYTCSASNPAGTSSASVQLIVTHNGQPTAGSVAASLCVSDTNDSIDNSTSSSPACSLATGPITTTTPEGCRVLEDVSRDERNRASVETVVGGKLFGPVFLHRPHHCLRATAGYTVEIFCVVTGNPAPRVWWTKDNVSITAGRAPQQAVLGTGEWQQHFRQDSNNTLRIHSVAENDGGVYECIAENSRGRQSATTLLGVWGAEDVCGCVKETRGEDGRRRKRITQGSEVTSPEHYPWQAPEYDIALVKLRYPAILNTAVRPACLPVVNSDPPVGTICYVSGWGHLDYDQGPSPSILHHTLVPLVNYSNCRHEDAYGNAVTRKHLCAGFEGGGPDSCQNDSGGPLVCERGRRWKVFGVVNNGVGCGNAKKYGLYARVVRYNSWIKAVLGM
ncbi:Transmembrane protease serine 3 [Geodia barretti]|uniref:Transmembrane protease serine 3 n=1 Tax=Geodia barretti TaxID=519541 RepID=A0AA35XMG0_GEOBA|nr:Transmembrane protease serine 3 [Geodia barretti]